MAAAVISKRFRGLSFLLFSLILAFNGLGQSLCEEFFLVQKNVIFCDGNAVFTITNEDGTYPANVNAINTSGFTYNSQSSTYNPANGQFTFVAVGLTGLTNYQQYSGFSFEIPLPGGGFCLLAANVVACCNEPSVRANAVIVVDEPLDNYISTGTTSGVTFVLMGDVTLSTGAYIINDSEFWLGPDAQLVPDDEISLTLNSTSLDPFCRCRWDRIFLDEINQDLTFNNVTMKGALRGIMADGEKPIALERSKFIDNFIAVNLLNFTGTGSFNDSYLKVDDCEFDFLNDPSRIYCYLNSSVALTRDVCDHVNNSPFVHIMIESSDNVHVGHATYGENTFTKGPAGFDAYGINIDNSQVFVRNNAMDGLTDLCSFNTSRVYAGGTRAQGNTFNGDLIAFKESSVIFDNNKIDYVNLTFDDPTYQLVATGAPVTGSQFNDNVFEYSTFDFDGFGKNSYIRLVDNEFKYCANIILQNLGFSTTRKIIFHSNRVTANSTTEAMFIENCDHIVFANNEVDNDFLHTPAANANYSGIKWNNNADGEVTGNIFKNFNRGLEIEGNNTGTQFTCNDFINNYHPFYLKSNPILSPQGLGSQAADNYYFYFTSVTPFPFGSSIAATANFVINSFTWFTSPASSCTGISQPNTVNVDCMYSSITSGLTITNGNTTPSCTIPANMKRAFYEEKYGEDLYFDPMARWTLYPNPAQNELNLEMPKPLEKEQLVIINTLGQIVLQRELKDLKTIIDVSSLKSGLYHLQAGDFKTIWLKQ